MPSARLSLPTRVGASLGEFFAIGDDWERPSPALARSDFVLFAAVELLGLFTLELVRSVDSLTQTTAPKWVQWLTVSLGAVLLLGRRRWPLAVATLGAAHMFVVGVTMPEVMGQFTLQIVYFITTFSAVAWARDRRLMRLVVGAIVLFMFLWIAWQFVLGSSVQEIVDHTKGKARTGIFPPVPAAVALTLIVNLLFFGGAIAAGQVSWRSARLRTRLGEQARTISEQAESLRRRAVIDERLRIARELHDVVGHHVSVIGVQAGAARRVLAKRPEAAADALGAIEESSREAVTQMRGLLGTLRSIETETETSCSTSHASTAVSSGASRPSAVNMNHAPSTSSGAHWPGWVTSWWARSLSPPRSSRAWCSCRPARRSSSSSAGRPATTSSSSERSRPRTR